MNLTDELLRRKLDVYAEDFEQKDKDIIEINYDEILDRVWDFEEIIKTEADLINRFRHLIDEYLNE